MTPHEERLLFIALADLWEMLAELQPSRIYPKRWIHDELTKAAGGQPFLGKGHETATVASAKRAGPRA